MYAKNAWLKILMMSSCASMKQKYWYIKHMSYKRCIYMKYEHDCEF